MLAGFASMDQYLIKAFYRSMAAAMRQSREPVTGEGILLPVQLTSVFERFSNKKQMSWADIQPIHIQWQHLRDAPVFSLPALQLASLFWQHSFLFIRAFIQIHF